MRTSLIARFARFPQKLVRSRTLFQTRRSLAVLAIVGALGFAGCGDDDEEEPTTTIEEETGATGATGETSSQSVLPADFIEEADAICAEGDEAIDAEAQELFGGGGEPSEKEQATFIEDVVVPNIQDQLDQLEALDPPEEGADEFQSLLDEANAALDELESNPTAFVEGGDPFAEANRQAQDLGFTSCGGG